jgi:hypothetical protein
LIDNGEMKVGEFQKAINVTSNAYSRFMTQHGQFKGVESSVYLAAWAFFKKREMRGIKTTANKKAKKNEGESAKDSVPSVDDVELDGEKEDEVPVFGKLCLCTSRGRYEFSWGYEQTRAMTSARRSTRTSRSPV